MDQRRKKKLDRTIDACLATINKMKLTREEVILTLAQLLIRAGYSFYYKLEMPTDSPPEKVTRNEVEKLFFTNPTTGVTLMQIGFDMQNRLLHRTQEKSS